MPPQRRQQQPSKKAQGARLREDQLRAYIQNIMRGIDPESGKPDVRYPLYTGHWSGAEHMGTGAGNLPYVPPAPGFGRQPVISAGGDMGRMLRTIENIVPGLTSSAANITLGPDQTYIEEMLKQDPRLLGTGKNPLPETYTAGLYNWKPESVYISPYERGGDLFETLVHELVHGAGALGEERPRRAHRMAGNFWEGGGPLPPDRRRTKPEQHPGWRTTPERPLP